MPTSLVRDILKTIFRREYFRVSAKGEQLPHQLAIQNLIQPPKPDAPKESIVTAEVIERNES
jgi:hypothetical protein